jgi:hypothetical protein
VLRVGRGVVLFAVAVAALAACGGGDNPDTTQACGPNGECPPGYACNPSTNRCVKSGVALPPDAAPLFTQRLVEGLQA